jgi:hypothetical protein
MVNPTGNSREYRTGYFRVEPEQTPSAGSIVHGLLPKSLFYNISNTQCPCPSNLSRTLRNMEKYGIMKCFGLDSR